jgi:hypothetical protein
MVKYANHHRLEEPPVSEKDIKEHTFFVLDAERRLTTFKRKFALDADIPQQEPENVQA